MKAQKEENITQQMNLICNQDIIATPLFEVGGPDDLGVCSTVHELRGHRDGDFIDEDSKPGSLGYNCNPHNQ